MQMTLSDWRKLNIECEHVRSQLPQEILELEGSAYRGISFDEVEKVLRSLDPEQRKTVNRLMSRYRKLETTIQEGIRTLQAEMARLRNFIPQELGGSGPNPSDVESWKNEKRAELMRKMVRIEEISDFLEAAGCTDMEIPHLAPVAEWRGVAILEGAGDIEKEWDGQKYTTDGRAYCFFHSVDDKDIVQVMIVPPDEENGISAERCVKAILDSMSEEELARGLNYLKVLVHLGRDNQQYREYRTWRAAGGRFEWDEQNGVFTRYEPPMFGSGKSRNDSFQFPN